MQKIIFNKAGIFFSAWEDKTECWADRSILDTDLPISYYLQRAIQIEEGLTIRDLLMHLKPYQEQLQLIFAGPLVGVKLDEIYMILDQATLKTEPSIISTICLLKFGEAIKLTAEESDKEEEDDDDGPFLNTYPVIMGLEMIGESGEDDKLHSLVSMKFNEWCDLKFMADDYIEYVDGITEDLLFHGVFNWSMYEVLCAIFAQIAVSVQLNQEVSKESSTSPIKEGPIQIKDIFEWLTDLDNIILGV